MVCISQCYLHVLFSTFLYCQCGILSPYSIFGEGMPGHLSSVPTTAPVLAVHGVLVHPQVQFHPVGVDFVIPVLPHGNESCDCSSSGARAKILLTCGKVTAEA